VAGGGGAGASLEAYGGDDAAQDGNDDAAEDISLDSGSPAVAELAGDADVGTGEGGSAGVERAGDTHGVSGLVGDSRTIGVEVSGDPPTGNGNLTRDAHGGPTSRGEDGLVAGGVEEGASGHGAGTCAMHRSMSTST
jgi:hypothetical protein